jgi:hypothetical protein
MLGGFQRCDGELTLTRQWLTSQAIDQPARVLAWLRARQVDCDCQVVLMLRLSDDTPEFDFAIPPAGDDETLVVQIFAAYMAADPAERALIRSQYGDDSLPFKRWDRIPTA